MKKVIGFAVLALVVYSVIVFSFTFNERAETDEITTSVASFPVVFETIVGPIDTGTFIMGSFEEEIAEQPSMDHPDYFIHDEFPAHEVTLTVPYEMSKCEVTNEQFVHVMNWAIDKGYARMPDGDLADSAGTIVYLGISNLTDIEYMDVQYGITISGEFLEPAPNTGNHPVHAVTWYGGVAFCNFLSERNGLEPVYDLSAWTWDTTRNGCRLPTEAEWEYAARKTERFTFAWGNDIDTSYVNL